MHWGVRHVMDGNQQALFAEAQLVLADQGYPIKSADPSSGVVWSHPIRHTPVVGASASHLRLSTHGDFQRIARIRIAQSPEGVSIYCRVEVQEQVTATQRIFHQGFAESDVPVDTPIDREAATTSRQNTVWRTVRRDKGAERTILEAILARARTDSPDG